MARLPKIFVLIRSTTIFISSFAIVTFLSRRSFYTHKDDKLVSDDDNSKVIIKKVITE